jgi:aspartate racemase
MAHIFQNEIAAATNIPLISIIDETVMAIRCDQPDAKAIGLLASEGCIRSGMYQAALEEKGLVPVLQTESELAKLMTLINSIKAGMRTEQVAIDMQNLATTLIGRGAQVIVAGCTEIPLVLNDEILSVPLISSTDVLAQKTVALARCDIELPE